MLKESSIPYSVSNIGGIHMYCGYRSFSFVDYPKKICSVLYTSGCNFRCPWCHNWKIAFEKEKNYIDEEQLHKYLNKSKKRVEALCISGGEPTIYEQLYESIRDIKNKFNFYIKLDTNGSNPKLLSKIIKSKNIDYVAMDIKSKPNKYSDLTAVKNYWEQVYQSVWMLRNSDIDYEFRMTYVPGLSDEKDIEFFENFLLNSEKGYITNAKSTEIYNIEKNETINTDKLIMR
ncbi:MAG: pyruvate formate lyase activating enzyme [Oceanotoga sp.]|nr:pyruvate formate lyase activating enzyme [Oceanotoga sp.]